MISRSVLVCLLFALKTVKCTEPVRVTGELPSADTIDYGVDLDAAGGAYGRAFGGYGGLGFGNGNGFGYGSDIALGPGIGYSGGYGGHGVGRFRGYKGHGNGLGYGGYGGFGGLGGYKGYRNLGGLGRGYGGYGGSLYGGGVEKSGFVKGGSSVNDGNYQKGAGHKGQVSERTAEGISSGQASEKDAKGETGHYSDSGADKKGYEDKKAYSGGSHYDSSGAKGGEHKAANGHKKGRLTKGFESSHHKDEVAKTTTFFDEENDEGDRYDYGGSHGKYGDQSSGSYHSGRQNDKYDANQYNKKGHFDQGHAKGKENADKLAYGNKVYYDNNNQYGETGGADHQSILGHSEANKVYKHHPYYY